MDVPNEVVGIRKQTEGESFQGKRSPTPTGKDCYTDVPGLFTPKYDEIHVSVTFSWDIQRAKYLARAFDGYGEVKIGGPAVGMRGEEFFPGMYIKDGYTITSRGCPNKCWFCEVWKREGNIRTLEIKPGWNILDDNLLAAPDDHVRKVFAMLRAQKKPAEFTGGLEAKLLKAWHVEEIKTIRLNQLFCAYDTPDDLGPLREAGKLFKFYGIKPYKCRAYVLCGYPKDSFDEAEKRMWETVNAGFYPFAMAWRNRTGGVDPKWRRFQKTWCRMPIIKTKMKNVGTHYHPLNYVY
jgi:hypothetical protein